MNPNDPNQPAGYPGSGGYPPPPQGGYAPPQQPYGAPPPGYPPTYGYPPKPKTGLWIGLGIGLLVLLGAGYFLLFDTSGREADFERGRARAEQVIKDMQADRNAAPASTGSAPAAPASSAIDQAYIRGNWCDANGTKLWFRPMGEHPTTGNLTVFPYNSGQVRSNAYRLTNNVVTVFIGNSNENQTLRLTKIDQDSMSAIFGNRPAETIRRC